jgi:hypothetical protein
VTRDDDIRKLIGAYATGTLTEAERKLLFDAALDDQELFDELTREHALKEILDEPGARDRLIAALEPPAVKRLVWWPWAAAGTAVAIAATVVAIVSLRTPARQEIAMVTPAPASAPVVREQPARPAPPSAPPSAAVAPSAPVAKNKVAKLEEAQANQPAAEPQAVAQLQANAAPPPAPPAARALDATAGRIAVAAAKAARFAFDYTIGPDGTLRITPAADGYLRVLPMNGDAAGPALTLEGEGPDGRVQAGSQVSASVSGRDAVEILFSASPGTAPAQPPERRAETSGTVTDPNPSPLSSLAVVVSVN